MRPSSCNPDLDSKANAQQCEGHGRLQIQFLLEERDQCLEQAVASCGGQQDCVRGKAWSKQAIPRLITALAL